MAIIYIKQTGRGRPLKFDTEKDFSKLLHQIPQAKLRLQEIRKATSGVRNEDILGSETSLPSSIKTTIDVFQALQRGEQINIETARALKMGVKTVQQLSSKQEKVYSRALAKALETQYEEDIKYQSKYASAREKQIYNRMLTNIKNLTQRQQQAFFTSRAYQDPRTNRRNYEHVKKWATEDIKKRTGEEIELTPNEAMAYLMERRQEDELANLEF